MKRPIAVTILGGLFIVAGTVGLVYHLRERPLEPQIVVVSRHHEPWDIGVFTSVGIDPRTKRYLLLKSRIHYRAGFAPLGLATVTLDGEGVTTSDNSRLEYIHVQRPVFPLDRLNAPPARGG